jgi:hypothetical protein
MLAELRQNQRYLAQPIRNLCVIAFAIRQNFHVFPQVRQGKTLSRRVGGRGGLAGHL